MEDYAVFSYNGKTIRLNERKFNQAVADGRLCGCGRCICCRAKRYKDDADMEAKKCRT